MAKRARILYMVASYIPLPVTSLYLYFFPCVLNYTPDILNITGIHICTPFFPMLFAPLLFLLLRDLILGGVLHHEGVQSQPGVHIRHKATGLALELQVVLCTHRGETHKHNVT